MIIKSMAWSRNGLRIASSVRVLLYILSFYTAISALINGFDVPVETASSSSWQEWAIVIVIGILAFALFLALIYLPLNAVVWILFIILFQKRTRKIMEDRLLSNRILCLDFGKLSEEEVLGYKEYIERNLDKHMVDSIDGLSDEIYTDEDTRNAVITISEYVAGMYYLGGPAYSSLADRELINRINDIVMDDYGNYKCEKSWIAGLLTDLQYTLAARFDEEDETD